MSPKLALCPYHVLNSHTDIFILQDLSVFTCMQKAWNTAEYPAVLQALVLYHFFKSASSRSFPGICLIFHMNPFCVFLPVGIEPQSIDPDVISALDIRGQGISDHQHVFHIPAAHFLEAVFKILRLRLLARGLLGNKNVLKIPVQARLAQTVVLGGRNAVGYDIKLILAL